MSSRRSLENKEEKADVKLHVRNLESTKLTISPSQETFNSRFDERAEMKEVEKKYSGWYMGLAGISIETIFMLISYVHIFPFYVAIYCPIWWLCCFFHICYRSCSKSWSERAIYFVIDLNSREFHLEKEIILQDMKLVSNVSLLTMSIVYVVSYTVIVPEHSKMIPLLVAYPVSMFFSSLIFFIHHMLEDTTEFESSALKVYGLEADDTSVLFVSAGHSAIVLLISFLPALMVGFILYWLSIPRYGAVCMPHWDENTTDIYTCMHAAELPTWQMNTTHAALKITQQGSQMCCKMVDFKFDVIEFLAYFSGNLLAGYNVVKICGYCIIARLRAIKHKNDPLENFKQWIRSKFNNKYTITPQ